MPSMNFKKLWRRKSVSITDYDPTYKVIYLGNVLTGWAKGDGCVEKPLATLWRNYCHSARPDISMKVTICSAGLRAVTQEHGLTEYWSHRVTHCSAHAAYPRVFCWVYRHEGRRLKQELRCHAILCSKGGKAELMAVQLKDRLASALQEFRREKTIRQNARLSLVNAIYESSALPMRKVYLITGSSNYRPPLERSKSAPKLGAIEEMLEEEEEEEEDRTVLLDIRRASAAVNSVATDPLRRGNGLCRDLGPSAKIERPSPVSINNRLLSVAYHRKDPIECDKLDVSSNSDLLEPSGKEHLKLSVSDQAKLNNSNSSLEISKRLELIKNDHFELLEIDRLKLDDNDQPQQRDGSDGLKFSGSRAADLQCSNSVLNFSSPNILFYQPTGHGGQNLALLETFDDNLPPLRRAEESLTSDQPESIASSSCSSSEGGAEEEVIILEVGTDNVIIIGSDDVMISKDRKCSTGHEEEDNISEESGYSEDKEILESVRVKV